VTSTPRFDEMTRAKLLLVLCGICWGLCWPVIKVGLTGLSPWSYRTLAYVAGAVTLVVVVKLTGRRLMAPRGMTWVHLFMSSMLNLAAFGLFSTIAMVTTTTSRVAVVSYSFPVWACLLAWLILGEKLRGAAAFGLLLCIAGLAVLIIPVIETRAMIGLSLSLASAMMWAVGTIYLKLIRIPGDTLVNTTWQIIMAAGVLAIPTLAIQGWPTFEPIPAIAVFAVVFNGVVGSALCYLLWYHVINHLPATTASLGSLASPAVGVVASALLLNEWPTFGDIIGFTLIFAAAVCAILQPRGRATPAMPEPEIQR
jgi:drug/metabolite transporter (DMT)-like permease